MIKNATRLNELSRLLQVTDPLVLAEVVTSLRDEEPFEGAIALLADLYENAKDKGLKRVIEEFMNDIRDKDARPELIAEINKQRSDETKGMLVASCWQSGLDYSEYITDIARVFLSGSYTTAIECMTLIGEIVYDCSDEQVKAAFDIINESPLAATKEKFPLTNELLSILVR